MDGATLLAFVMNAGLALMLVVPALAALWVKLVRNRGAGHATGLRSSEIEDVLNPARRRQVEQIEASESLRVDAENGDGDPLDDFPDPDGVRDQLDPEHVHEGRRRRSRQS